MSKENVECVNERPNTPQDVTKSENEYSTKQQQSQPQTPEQRTNIPDILRHQHSFEARYSNIIHKQIWETSINKEVLERQMNAYLPFARSTSLQKDAIMGFDHILDAVKQSKDQKQQQQVKEKDSDSIATVAAAKQKRLEKLETLDVADQAVNAEK